MTAKILIVEDEPHIVEAVRFLFQREGWHCAEETDGAKAVEAVSISDPDLIILDQMLPNLSGIDIVKALRQIDSSKRVPILMLTAKGQARDRQMAELAGVTSFMTKPFANGALVDEARRLLDGNTP